MSGLIKYIEVGKIVAAIAALKNAIPFVYGKPHYQNYAIAAECIDAKCDLEAVIRDIEVMIKIEAENTK